MLLQHGVKSNAMNHRGETALHVMSRGKSDSKEGVCVARLLLEHGVNVNAEDKDHDTPLHSACYNGKLEIVRLLIDHGADANIEDDKGETALHKVSCGKHKLQDGVHITQLLLENGGVDVDRQNKKQQTPLHLTSYDGKLEIARLLLDRGAKVDAVDDEGISPLHEASYRQYDSEDAGVGVARLLLERGADVNARSNERWTPLRRASYHAKPEIAHLLLDCGAWVDALDDEGFTPLHCVSRGDYSSEEAGACVAKLLLERGASVSVRSNTQRTPLHCALYNAKLDIARVLLDNRSPVDTVDDEGFTPLHCVSRGEYASEEAGVAVAWLLLEGGADVNAQARDRRTPLHVASYYGKLEIVRLLLDRGAKVNAVDDWGDTPLHDVSRNECDFEDTGVGIARLLLEHGADVDAKSRFGKTPFDLAFKRPNVAQILLKHSAISGVNMQPEPELEPGTRGPRESSSQIRFFRK